MARRKIVFIIVEGVSDETALGIAFSQIFDKDSACEKLLYEDDGIYASDVDCVISRNRRKTGNLYRLRSCGKAWNIPYRVYYMSCNLDHVLYDKEIVRMKKICILFKDIPICLREAVKDTP